MAEQYKGGISQWNEGDLKNLRLHKAKEIINFSKLNFFKKMSLFGGQIEGFGYELWFYGIEMLFGEGEEKYSTNEYDEVCKLRYSIEDFLNGNQITYQLISNHSKVIGIGVYPKQWVYLKKKLREFEYKVKLYNDSHGLSTRNKEEEDEDDY